MPRSKKPRQKRGKGPRKAARLSGATVIARAIGEAARLFSLELRHTYEALDRIEGLLVKHLFEGRRSE